MRRRFWKPARPPLIDGYNGLLIVHPSLEETLREYTELGRHRGAIAESLTRLRETKSTTRDGRHIVLSANIELPEEVDAVPPTARKESVSIGRNSSTSTKRRCRRRRSNSRSTTPWRSESRPIL